ncbi:11753_t:CDS:2 [Cetraspora pellucida]|uniref:11753_t:CDS:1 n=1 Tax=Cetraspora pellucida TaxID=1433469 RepID=A0ACA9KQQ2_9GLOM|nr:11753_t:CDS:2 [Cetraspora pellucida]
MTKLSDERVIELGKEKITCTLNFLKTNYTKIAEEGFVEFAKIFNNLEYTVPFDHLTYFTKYDINKKVEPIFTIVHNLPKSYWAEIDLYELSIKIFLERLKLKLEEEIKRL